jgi:hypothetical protein
MKIKKFKFKHLLKLHLLKSRVYEQPIQKTNINDLTHLNLDHVLVGVKKALQVIFQYNQTNKRILFIGLSSKLELKINSLTRHVAVSNSFNIQGLISNNNVNFPLDIKISSQKPIKQGSPFFSPKLAKKPDLIILFDHEKSSSVLSEAWLAKIPVITFAFNNDCKNQLTSNSYVVNGNFKNILSTFDKNIFFVGLNFLFKNLKKKKVSSVAQPLSLSLIEKRSR